MDDSRTVRSPIWQPRPATRLRVRVVDGVDAGLELDSDARTVTVGGSTDNTIVLCDPTVSRYHLEICRTEAGVHIEDLGSLNGTFHAQVRVHRVTVPPETRLVVGQTTLELSDGDAAAPAENAAPVIPGLLYRSPLMAELGTMLTKLAPSDVSVLLQGETGTGKEVLARALHELSPRKAGSFEVVDCGSMPATLIASELFGHERGAFTGADRKREGAFERVGKGTLFLDEVGELPLDLQASLLGVLERKRFRRVGGSVEVPVRARVVAASHRDLRSAVNEGGFRADLYFRLAAARLLVPPLRERPEDIDLLIEHFVLEATGSSRIPFGGMALEALRQHRWTGNVRELRNAVEAALVLGVVQLEGDGVAESIDAGASEGALAYKEARAEAVKRFEKRYFQDLMKRCDGNASKAAREARMDRPYMLTILRRHGLR